MGKAKHCDECRHATVKWYVYRGPPAFDVLTCSKKHKPRFYMPRNDNPLDDSYGWKRVCADFETANAKVSGARRLYRRASGWTTGCAATAQKSALVGRCQKGKK